MICLLVGYENDTSVDETILGFIFKITQSTKFNYACFISDSNHEQLEHYEE
jgi:hypothetical protein